MLEDDYLSRFGQLIQAVPWEIVLPRDWTDYFEQRGEATVYDRDARASKRLLARTYAVLWFQNTLSFCHRSPQPVGIYSRDFSRQGVGFLAPMQLFPEEQVRIALPTLCVDVKVTRARRITSHCFEIGTVLLNRHDPDPAALASPAGVTVLRS
jgi:hypothetical protein